MKIKLRYFELSSKYKHKIIRAYIGDEVSQAINDVVLTLFKCFVLLCILGLMMILNPFSFILRRRKGYCQARPGLD
jgi:hypothetical protein